jgi:ankyrin repeat protein
VDPNVTDRDCRQPVHWAAAAGAGDALISLVHHGAADIHMPDSRNGLTALHCTAAAGHADCLVQLITLCGARVNAPDANGCTPLFYAASQGHRDCVDSLLSLGAEPNAVDQKGRTAAHGAAARNHLDVLSELLRHEGNLWLANGKGNLPLHEAVAAGHRDVVRWLLARRPSAVTAENGAGGRQPLHVAAAHVTATDKAAMIRLLVDEFHAPVNAICRDVRNRRQLFTPLDLAQRHSNNRAAVRFLRQAGGLSAKQLVNGVALRQALADALERHQHQQLHEAQHERPHLAKSSIASQLDYLTMGQNPLLIAQDKASALPPPLLYSPEVVLSPISPFSWRSCYTVNTEQGVAELSSSSRSFVINQTSALDGDLIGGGGGDDTSPRGERWHSISSANFTHNEEDSRRTNSSNSSNNNSYNDSIFVMADAGAAFPAIPPRTHSAPDLTAAAGWRYEMPDRLGVGSGGGRGGGGGGLGGSLQAGLDQVAGRSLIDTSTPPERCHSASGGNNSKDADGPADENKDDDDNDADGGHHHDDDRREHVEDRRQLTFALASPPHGDNNFKGRTSSSSLTMLPSWPSPQTQETAGAAAAVAGSRRRSQDEDLPLIGGEASQPFVYEATFRIVTHPPQQRRLPQPKTTAATTSGIGEPGGDLWWRWQRRRRRHLHEQLLRRQLAAVREQHRRMLAVMRMAEAAQLRGRRYEATAVNRLVAAFNEGLMRQQLIGLRAYGGPNTFAAFEAYLEGALDEVTG